MTKFTRDLKKAVSDAVVVGISCSVGLSLLGVGLGALFLTVSAAIQISGTLFCGL